LWAPAPGPVAPCYARVNLTFCAILLIHTSKPTEAIKNSIIRSVNNRKYYKLQTYTDI